MSKQIVPGAASLLHPTRLVVVILVTAVLLGSSTTSNIAWTDDDPWVPNLVNISVYPECVGSTSVDNVSRLEGDRPGWSTDRPQGSLHEGEGCAAAVDGLTPRPCRDPVLPDCPIHPVPEPGIHLPALQWSGDFDGNLDVLTVRLYKTGLPIDTVYVRPALWIDDEEIILSPAGTPFHGAHVPAEPTEVDGVWLVEFSITGLGLLSEAHDRTHGLRFELQTPHVDNTQQGVEWANLASTLWLWGAREAPSGLEFNPSARADATLRRW